MNRGQVRRHTHVGFQQCPGCSYDFITGEGSRACHWFECPYLPEELKVLCPDCNYNFATGEGQPHCAEDPTCEFAVEGHRHAAAARRVFGGNDGEAGSADVRP